MNRLKTAAITGLLSAAMLAAGPVFAQTHASATPRDSGDPTGATPGVSCGKIVELQNDHLTLRNPNGDLDVIKLAPLTNFGTPGLGAAKDGLQVGDFARARTDDTNTDGTAKHVEWAEHDICRDRDNNEEFKGTVNSFQGSVLTITDQFNNAIAFNTTKNTKYYVNGVLQQTPPQINPGATVRVLGHQAKDNSWTALRINLLTQSHTS